ncbi:MAG: hypothetical protein AVDCRST_MAG19-243, partial [uncultured Thermomicrobiales bacterium]
CNLAPETSWFPIPSSPSCRVVRSTSVLTRTTERGPVRQEIHEFYPGRRTTIDPPRRRSRWWCRWQNRRR